MGDYLSNMLFLKLQQALHLADNVTYSRSLSRSLGLLRNSSSFQIKCYRMIGNVPSPNSSQFLRDYCYMVFYLFGRIVWLLSLLPNARCLKLVTACRIKAALIHFAEKRGSFWLCTCVGEKWEWVGKWQIQFSKYSCKSDYFELKKKSTYLLIYTLFLHLKSVLLHPALGTVAMAVIHYK